MDKTQENFSQSQEHFFTNENNQMNHKKILIIYTGGTFGMSINEKTQKLVIDSKASLENVLKQIPEFYDKKKIFLENNGYLITRQILGIRIFYKIYQFPKLIDSSDSNLQFLLDIKSVIQQHYEDYDGFLIIHGTDTIEYTGAMLSFLTKHIDKTIIITGSQIPLSLIKNDARQNLVGCLRIFAYFEIPGVNLYFNNRLYQANVCKKTNTTVFQGFQSMKPALVVDEINFDFDPENIFIRRNIEYKAGFYHNLSDDFFAIQYQNQLSMEFWESLFLGEKYKAIIVYFEEGFIDNKEGKKQLSKIMLKSVKKKIVICILQHIFHKEIQKNEIIKKLMKNNVIFVANILFSTASSKISWLLGNFEEREKIEQKFLKNCRGEFFEIKKTDSYTYSNYFLYFCNYFKLNQISYLKNINETILATTFEYLLQNHLIGLIEQLQQNGFCFHCQNSKNEYPILKICSYEEKDFIEKLYDIGIDFEQKDDYGSNAAYYALINKNITVLDFFVSKNILPLSSTYQIYQDLQKAVLIEDLKMLELFLHTGLDDIKNYLDYDKTNLGLFALQNNKEKVFEFLQQNSNINIYSENYQGFSCEKFLKNKKQIYFQHFIYKYQYIFS